MADSEFVGLLESSDDIVDSYSTIVPVRLLKSVRQISDIDWKLYFLQWGAILAWAENGASIPVSRRLKKIIASIIRKSDSVSSFDELSRNVVNMGGIMGTDSLAAFAEHLSTFIIKGAPTYISAIANIGKWNHDPIELERETKWLEGEHSIRGIPEDVVDDNGDEILIDFGDGFAWWKLDRASCQWEAKAGGHCGNLPREDSGDIILSLREKKTDGKGNVYYKVHLTFVLSHGGYLTEMKARFNAKPGSEYHKYIIPLLEHPIVKGILYGFYDNENDFFISDLPEAEMKRLLELKPGLDRDVAVEEVSQVFREELLARLQKYYGASIVSRQHDNPVSFYVPADATEAFDVSSFPYFRSVADNILRTRPPLEELYVNSRFEDLVYEWANSDMNGKLSEMVREYLEENPDMAAHFRNRDKPGFREVLDLASHDTMFEHELKDILYDAASVAISDLLPSAIEKSYEDAMRGTLFTFEMEDAIDDILTNSYTVDDIFSSINDYVQIDEPDFTDVVDEMVSSLIKELSPEDVISHL